MSALNLESIAPDKAVVRPELKKLRKATEQIVGSVFYGALLKTMRDSKLKGPFGHGGRGEEIFGAQLHGLWAEKMGEASHRGVADALFRHLERQQSLMSAGRTRLPEGVQE